MALYDRVLTVAGDKGDVLMMVTGDLGNAGAVDDLIRLGAPRYTPETHGPLPGLNLLEAYKTLGRVKEGRELVRRLQAMKLAPFAARLAEVDAALAALELPRAETSPPEVVAIPFDGPLWTRGLFEPDWLLTPPDESLPYVCLFPFADETISAQSPMVQAIDTSGRFTRALPLYLAESLRMRRNARVRVSLMVAKGKGPVVFGKPSDAGSLAPLLPQVQGRRVVITGSLVPEGARVRIEDGVSPEQTFLVRGSVADASAFATAIEGQVLSALAAFGLSKEAAPSGFYRVPAPDLLGGYLLVLEQLFLQLLAANDLVKASSFTNERGFFESYFGLVEAWPSAPESARLIAICGVLAAQKYGSVILEPYRKIVAQWTKEASPKGAIRRLAPAIYLRLDDKNGLTDALASVPSVGDVSYMQWMDRVRGASTAS